MLRIGIVGFGFMGRMHHRCWLGADGATVAAICEANPEVVQRATQPAAAYGAWAICGERHCTRSVSTQVATVSTASAAPMVCAPM